MGNRLQGRTAIVTGAGSCGPGWGNGKAAAVLYAREGARIFAVDIDIDAARETSSIIASEGGDCTVHSCDVSRGDEVQAMVQACAERYGSIDVLHNNVGIIDVGGVVETSEGSWDRVVQVNLKSIFLTCKHTIPHMESQGKGSIVNIASTVGIRWHGVPYISYSSTKAAIIQFTKATAMQYAARNIRCNAVLPGFINTPFVHKSLAEFYSAGDIEKMIAIRDRQCPMGKMGEAWDVAYAALFLASDESKYVTGAELVVDGGLTCSTSEPK